jgi:N-acetylglutamate synthase-like GNAT family acetyltransferase
MTTPLTLRAGAADDAPALLALVEAHRSEGHLLPRTLDDLVIHAARFVLAPDPGGAVIGCAELAPLSLAVAEVRTLVVDRSWRGLGLGSRLVGAVQRQARRAGFTVLCAFAHDPRAFVRLGFSLVPHVWFPEKVAIDCASCPLFRACGQYALALPLDGASLLAPGASHRRLPVTATAGAPAGRLPGVSAAANPAARS